MGFAYFLLFPPVETLLKHADALSGIACFVVVVLFAISTIDSTLLLRVLNTSHGK